MRGPASKASECIFGRAERMFCVLCRRLFWRDPKPAGRLMSRSRTRAVRRAAVKTRSSVRAAKSMGQGWEIKLANAEPDQAGVVEMQQMWLWIIASDGIMRQKR